jgi:hypothetical protein
MWSLDLGTPLALFYEDIGISITINGVAISFHLFLFLSLELSVILMGSLPL